MRPVTKGQSPQTEYSHYRDARDDLEERIGLFCSYCEQPIQHVPEIEHVQPKSRACHLEKDWKNLLLSCSSCNTTKGDKLVEPDQVAMPDKDNTFRGLVFREGGRIEVSPCLVDNQANLMRQTVKLVRLDRHPDAEKKKDQPTDRDKRAYLRSDVWDIANRYLGYIKQPQRCPLLRKLIAEDIAPSKGFFSVWMTVFRDHPDMLKRFIQAFPGTSADCFDDAGQAVHRPGGRL